MAIGIKCLNCGRIGYTCSPQKNNICPYCGQEDDFPPKKETGIKGQTLYSDSGEKEEKN